MSCPKAAGSVVGSVVVVLGMEVFELLVVGRAEELELDVVVLVTLEVVLDEVLSPSEHAATTRRVAKRATDPLARVFNADALWVEVVGSHYC